MNPMYPMNLTNFEAMAKAHQKKIDERIAKIHQMQKQRIGWAKIHDHIRENPGTSAMRIFQMIQQSMGKDFFKELIIAEAPNRVKNIDQEIEYELNDLRMIIGRD